AGLAFDLDLAHPDDAELPADARAPSSRFATFFPPWTGRSEAGASPPPSAYATASAASNSRSPARSPSIAAAKNRRASSSLRAREASNRGFASWTCLRARTEFLRGLPRLVVQA